MKRCSMVPGKYRSRSGYPVTCYVNWEGTRRSGGLRGLPRADLRSTELSRMFVPANKTEIGNGKKRDHS